MSTNKLSFNDIDEAVAHGPTKRRLKVGDKFYRWRRDELVEIPEKWVGNTVHPQTIRKRKSKDKL